MKVEIVVPASGESVTEGDIARWYKKPGEFVQMDDALLELETDKTTLEINAEADGLLEILAEEGTTVKVGEVIGYLDTSVTKGVAPTRDIEPGIQSTGEDSGNEESDKKMLNNGELSNDRTAGIPSPAARKLMTENGVSSTDIKATGKKGRITKQDVLRFLEARKRRGAVTTSKQQFVEFYNSGAPVISPDETVTLLRQPFKSEASTRNGDTPVATPVEDEHEAEPSQSPDAVDESELKKNQNESLLGNQPTKNRATHRKKISRLRKTIAQRLVDVKQNTALLTTFNEVDMSAIQSIRRKYKEQFWETHQVKLGLMSFFTKAVCHALQEFPVINAQINGDTIIYFDYCDIGVAVATPKGLVVPVLRNVEFMSIHEIEYTINDLALKARNQELALDDLTGGTFTITNGGVYGSMLSTPILNSPQSAILGMHNIIERPIAEHGEIVIRPMMYVALTYDHRLIDGAEAVQFLRKVKMLCEDPIKLVLHL